MAAPALTERNWSVLGLLRFTLAATVMAGHLPAATGLRNWVTFFGGFGPVCGFFMVSGFSIAASLSTPSKGYYERRLRRIYPLSITSVFLTIIIISMIVPTMTPSGLIVTMPASTEIFATLFLLNGILVTTPFFLGPLWTLSCEIVYYLIAPLIRGFSTQAVTGVMSVSGGLFVSLLVLHPTFSYPTAKGGVAIISLYWVWLLGFLAWRHPANKWLIAIGLSTTEFLIGYKVASDGILSAIMFFIAGLTVCYVSYLGLPKYCVSIANYLGELSYPIYVFHVPIILLSGWLFAGRSMLLAGCSSIVGTFLISIAAYHGIDRRFRTSRRVCAE